MLKEKTMSRKKKIIIVDRLVKKYDDICAVDKVSFSINTGEVFCLLGPNGSGKTTLFSILSTLNPQTEGTVIIDGYPITNKKEIRKIIGVVPQEISVYRHMTVYDNLVFWYKLYNLPKNEMQSRFSKVIELVQLQDFLNRTAGTLSGGMLRRVNIALSLLHEPKILLLDEPTVGIDIQTRKHIIDSLRQVNAEGVTILYTSHYIEEIQEIADRVAIMDYGRILAIGSINELLSSYANLFMVEVKLAKPFAEVREIIAGAWEDEDYTVVDDATLQIKVGDIMNFFESAFQKNGLRELIKSIKVEKFSLADLFLTMTGKKLRE